MMNRKKHLLSILLTFISATITAQHFEWGGRFGGTGEDVIRAMHVDDSGNSYTTGYFTDTADFDISANESNLSSNGFFDVFVQKTNADGTFQWAKGFGGTFFDYGTGITADDQGNVYITGVYEQTVDFDPGAGTFPITSSGQQDIFIVKLDADGNFVWAKSVGGIEYEESTAIGVDPFGNVVVIGYLYNTVDFDPGPGEFLLNSIGGSDSFILKLNQSGDLVTAQRIGGADLDLAMDMHISTSGDVYITGFFEGTSDLDPNALNEFLATADPNSYAGYILHLNNANDFMSAVHTRGGSVTPRGIQVDAMGNVVVNGYFDGEVNFDPDPMAGNEFLFQSTLASNAFLMKTDAFGNLSWARHFQSDEPFFGYDLALDAEGNILTTGFFGGTADFDPSASGTFELTKASPNAMDAFLSKVDTDGNFVSAFQFGGVDFVDTHQIGTDDEGNIYLGAQFGAMVDLDPMPGSNLEVTALDFRDNYLVKMNSENLGVSTPQEFSMVVYPNPVSEKLFIADHTLESETAYVITDLTGKKVQEGIISQERAIDFQRLQKGLYLLKISGRNAIKVMRE